jgi:hypothetical protein
VVEELECIKHYSRDRNYSKGIIYSNSFPLFEGTPSKTEGEFLDSKVTERWRSWNT